MSIPIDHHFLAEFYLERWADESGRVVEYQRPSKFVVRKHKFPSATGFLPHLYSVPSRPDAAAQQAVELQVMSPLDFEASKALCILEHVGDVEDTCARTAWARYLTSLLYRSPRRVAGLKDKVQTLDTSRLEEEYAKRRSPADPPTAAAFLAQVDPAFHEESAALLLTKLLEPNRRATEFIAAMRWKVVQLGEQQHPLLTSDDPVLMSNGVLSPEGFMALPIGPRTMFLATNGKCTEESFVAEWAHPRASVGINDAVCRQASFLVIGSSDRHLLFVERRLTKKRIDLSRNSWRPPRGAA